MKPGIGTAPPKCRSGTLVTAGNSRPGCASRRTRLTVLRCPRLGRLWRGVRPARRRDRLEATPNVAARRSVRTSRQRPHADRTGDRAEGAQPVRRGTPSRARARQAMAQSPAAPIARYVLVAGRIGRELACRRERGRPAPRRRLPEHEADVAHAEDRVREALRNLRGLAHGIFPAVLASEGLRARRRGPTRQR